MDCDYVAMLEQQRQFFQTGTTRNVADRIEQLRLLRRVIEENQTAIAAALKADLHKPEPEAYLGEILSTLKEIKYALKHIRTWVTPHRVAVSPLLFPSRGFVQAEPVGVVLIIAPWNYPFSLVLSPLVGAIAAGNCAILKPSEYAPHTSKLVAELINKNFEPGLVRAIEGGKETSQALLQQKFDHIFFTGSTRVGKIVMAAAAKHLTPVTLELGGKSPTIVEADCDLPVTAKRIASGKFFNAGQTCIAPDYVLVNQKIKDRLIQELTQVVKEFYPATPQESKDYARIVSNDHCQHLHGLLEHTRANSKAQIVTGGEVDIQQRFVAPTIVDGGSLSARTTMGGESDRNSPASSFDLALMQAEIFGPILPIFSYEDLDQAIDLINSLHKPLALYFFSSDRQKQKRILQETSSGAVCLNDTVSHYLAPQLPFGGVGNSGLGKSHGKYSFDAFSHHKAILAKPTWFDAFIRYPPYKQWSINVFKWFL
ncbi:Aldehyde Dehydrogenase [Thalassoporum mexicanum PCC 7367]|nr:Aldehyde Dehydrogenase [Pseudanabaena sp. PCC 7367]